MEEQQVKPQGKVVKTLGDIVGFTMAAAISFGYDAISPQNADIGLIDTVSEAALVTAGSQLRRFDSLGTRAKKAAVIYAGSVTGQIIYHFVKPYL